MNTILQIPIDRNIRNQAAYKAEKMGFSSLQEIVRVFLSKIAAGGVNVKFEDVIQLSPESITRYNKIIDQIELGAVEKASFSNTDSLMNYLNED